MKSFPFLDTSNSVSWNGFEEDSIDEVKVSTSPLRKKSKAFTQLEPRKNIYLECKAFEEEDFEQSLINSTKRHYSFDELVSSLNKSFDPDEEIKQASPRLFIDIKRNDIKKKKFLGSEVNLQLIDQPKKGLQKLMSEETVNMIKNTLMGHFLFGNMDLIQMFDLYFNVIIKFIFREGVITKMFPSDFAKEQFIFKQGEPATSFYLIGN